MENYKDPPVTLTIKKFGREEFCLITGLRFGLEYSEHYVECINPFRRLLFGSDIDGGHITGQMLLDKINGEVFDKVQDKDVVAVCQLGVLHLVWDNCIFLFSTMATNPNDVRLSVLMALQEVHDEKACLEEQILSLMHCFDDRFTNRRPEINRLMTLPDHPLIEYGRYTLGCMTGTDMKKATYLKMVTDELLKSMEDYQFANHGARPNRKLRPDAFEAKAEWWVCSQDFFDGRIREAPPIPPPVNLTSRFDVPKHIDQRFDEQQQIRKELQKKNEAQDRLLNEVYNFYKGQSKPVEVREHYGLTDFSGFQNSQGFQQVVPKMFTTQASDSFYDVGQTTPIYSATFEQPMPSRYPTSYPGTLHIATPIAQQGFALWSSTSYQAGPSHVGGVNPLTPFTCLPDTTVAPKKRANNIRNTTRNAIVSPFNLGKAGIDLNSQVEELMYLGSRATDDYISLHNVDHTKVVRYKYVDCMRFLESPESVYLDCFIKRFVVKMMPAGARYTVAKTGTSSMLEISGNFLIEIDFHLMGMLDGSSSPYPSWDEVDIVYMPINT
ncbi:hypothetical protein Tco_0718190 [Tanacetum coccineum]